MSDDRNLASIVVDGAADDDGTSTTLRSVLAEGLSRRSLLRRSAAFGLSVPVIAGLLSACGSDDDEPDEEPADAEPTEPAASTEPTATTEDETEEPEATADESAGEEAESTEPAAESSPEPESSAQGGTLIFAMNNNTDTLDPDFASRIADRYLLYLVYNTMVAYDVDFNITPDLAESWEIDDDGMGITFLLREGVTFHDGTACDAEAVSRVYERRLDPEVGSFQRSLLAVVDSVEAVDELSVKFNLSSPSRPILAALGERPGVIVSPSAVEEFGEDYGRNPVGTGPFKFVEWVDDSHMIFERNEDYWDEGKPLLDGIEIRHITDTQVKLTALRTGEVHVIDQIDPTLVGTLEGESSVVVESLTAGRVVGLRWWLDEPPFDNRDLRIALAYATDRQEITDIIYGGAGGPGLHPIGAGWAFDPTIADEAYSFDLEKAQEHIDAAGVAGETFTLNVANESESLDLAQLLKSQYEKLGITIEIAPQNAADINTMSQEKQINWLTSSWAPRADPDGLMRLLWHTDGARNMGYSNPELDALLDEAAVIYDTEEAAPLYHQAERIIVEDVQMLFMWRSEEFAAHTQDVTNFVMHPDLILRLREFGLSSGE